MQRLISFLWMIIVVAPVLVGCMEMIGEGEEKDSSSETPSAVQSPITFSDVTARAGLGEFNHRRGTSGEKWMPETLGPGVAFIDYNQDDWPDLLLVGGGVWPEHSDEHVSALRLYRNDGDGTFTEVTADAGLGGFEAYGMGVTIADYDNDGDDDFYFTTLHRNMLFRNDDGRFREVAVESGVEGPDEWSTCSVFFDADRDGHVDLYTCGYVVWPAERKVECYLGDELAYCAPEDYTGLAGRFYRNLGDGTFEERTEEAGFLPFGGKSLGVVEIDVDKDGWLDLVVANDSERNLFYHNNGDGTFTEKAVRTGVAFDDRGNVRGGMGIDAGDVTGDGKTTVFIGNFSEQMIGVFEQTEDVLFRDRAAASRVGQPSFLTLTFGLLLLDVELDGDLDLFVANGHIQERYNEFHDNITYRQAPQLFLNRGDGTFDEHQAAPGSPLTRELVARGAAYGDFDRDGDLDIVITESAGPAHLWRNESEGGHHLRVELEGQTSNRSGLGAYIVAVTGEDRMERWIQSGGSYLSTSEQVATFGLDQSEFVDTLEIHWPSGSTQEFVDVSAGQHIRITEGKPSIEVIRPTGNDPPL